MTDPELTRSAHIDGSRSSSAGADGAGRGLWFLYAISIVLLVSAFGLALHDLANSNRPHELDKSPFVLGLLSLNLAACVTLLVRVRRAMRSNRGQRHAAVLQVTGIVVLVHVAFSAFVWIIALQTVIVWAAGGD